MASSYTVRQYKRYGKPYLLISYQVGVNDWKTVNVPSKIARTLIDEDKAKLWWEDQAKKSIITTTSIKGLFPHWERIDWVKERDIFAYYRMHIVNHTLKHPIADIDLSEDQSKHMSIYIDFLEHLKKKNLCRGSVKSIAHATKRMIEDLGKKNLIPFKTQSEQSLFSDRRIMEHLPIQGKKVKRVIPLKTLQSLLVYDFDANKKNAHDNLNRKHPFYFLAAATGMRASEIAGLLWENIHFQGTEESNGIPVIRVNHQLKRGKNAGLKKVKTKNANRSIPIHKDLIPILTLWKSQWAKYVKREPKQTDLVFTNSKGESLKADNFARFLQDDLKKAGLKDFFMRDEKPITLDFHSFRRSFSTLLAEQRIPAELRRGLMGHADKSTEEDRYLEKSLQLMREAVDSLPLLPKVEVMSQPMSSGSRREGATNEREEESPSDE